MNKIKEHCIKELEKNKNCNSCCYNLFAGHGETFCKEKDSNDKLPFHPDWDEMEDAD